MVVDLFIFQMIGMFMGVVFFGFLTIGMDRDDTKVAWAALLWFISIPIGILCLILQFILLLFRKHFDGFIWFERKYDR